MGFARRATRKKIEINSVSIIETTGAGYSTVASLNRKTFETANTLEGGLVTKPELAKILRISCQTVDNWMRAKILPYIKVGRLVRFNVRRCLEALARFERLEIR